MNAEVLLPRRLARATATLFGGNLAMLGLQTLQFVLLARWLGVASFGQVAAANALISIAIPLAGLGYGNLLLLRVSRDRSVARTEWGNALVAVVAMGVLLVGVAALISWGVFSGPGVVTLVVTMAVSELIFVRSVALLGQLYQAMDRVEVTSALNIATASCRVIAVLVMMAAGVHEPMHWAVASCALTCLLALVANGVAARAVGGADVSLQRLWSDRRDALHFSLGTGAKAFYTDFDKVMLARTALSPELGAYTAAYRLVTMAFLPVRSLLDASASQFYRHGGDGIARSDAFARRVLRIALPCGLAGAALILIAAEIAPLVLGASFRSATPMLRVLALLPIIQSIHYVYSDALTAAGFQKLRTRLQWFVAAVYAVLAFALVPAFGWRGAVAVCLVSELLLAVLVVLAVRRRLRTDQARA
ncbi:MAG: lipopolysaccharide biosynthesis protein [Gammaproteobacteria bacterium]